MADKYWWEEYEKKNTEKQGYWWDDGSTAQTVGVNIANRVNTWLKNHDNYVSNYRNRYAGRKYNYEDSYVKDSGSWMATVSKQADAFEAERQSILSYMDQYKGYLDDEWMESVRNTLESGSYAQNQIRDIATQDNDWWTSFGDDQNLVGKYGSAEGVYNYFQRADGYNKKYTGMTDDDIRNALSALDDGEEKAWLDSYRWRRYLAESDFDKYANAGAAIKNPTMTEAESDGRFLWWEWDGADIGNIVTYSRENADKLAMAGANNENTKGNYVYRSMEDDEVKLYNYLLAKYGKEKGDEFLSYLMDDLRRREGGAMANRLRGIDIPVVEEAAIGAFGLMAGVDQWASGTRQLLTNDKQSATVEQYANSDIANSLDGFGKYAYQATNVVGNMLPSIALSKGLGALGAGVKAARLVGATTMSISAAGNAYSDGLDYGMEPWQARTYGTLVGVAEGALEYALGGIPAISKGDKFIDAKIKLIDNGLLRIGAKLGWDIVEEIREEELQNYLEPLFRSFFTGEYDAPTFEELLETAITTAISTPVMGGGDTIINDVHGGKTALKEYGNKTDTLIKEGLESDVNTDSYKLAQKYQQQVQGKDGKGGKALTGNQIRNLLAANQEQITPKDMKLIQKAAEKRLADLGQTEDVPKLAELATKYATGQKLTRAERRELAISDYGSRVANELLPKNIESGEYTTDWAEEIGTREINAKEYNNKKIDQVRTVIEKMKKLEDPALYKPLEKRMEAEAPAQVSDTGKAVISATGEEIDLTNPTFKEITRSGVVLEVDGKPVNSEDIDFESEDQGLAVAAIGRIEHITPAAAGALYAKLDMTKPVMEQLNGMDEAFTYGFYNYSEADMKAGLFTGSLTKEQLKDAYNLGRYVAKNDVAEKTTAIKKMRTAGEVTAEKKAAEGKKAPKAKTLTITYNHGNGVVEDITTAEKKLKLNDEQKAAVEVAKLLHQMGLGTDFELFMSRAINDEGSDAVEVFTNDDGQEEAAYAGLYLAADGKIRINLNAYSGTKGLALNALSHELVHFIKTWSSEKYTTMAEFLTDAYGESGMTMHQRVLREQARLKNIRNQEVSYGEAYDEVIANALNRMFDDGKVLEKLNELTVKDKGLVEKILEGIKRFFNRFLKAYQNNQSLFRDTEALMEMKEAFEQLQNMFAEALVNASENFQAAQQVGFEMDAQTESIAPAVAMKSENTWKQSDYVQEREAAASEISEAIGISVKKAKAYIDSVNSIAKMIAEDRSRLDYFSSPGRSSFIGNVEYGGSFDFSTLCKKRRLLTGTFTAIQKALPNTALTADEILDIRNRMKDQGLEVSCGLCYVEGSRANMGQFAKEFLRLYKQYYPDAWQPNMADVNTPDGIEWVRINHPECYEQYEYFWNHYGTLKPGDKNLFASQQKPKLYQLHTEYKGEILQKFKDDDNVEEKNLNGGIRLQSFSDFEIVHLIDTMQIIMDMSRVGLAGQAYTKVPDFAWALGDTGLKINLSLIAKGVDENGKLIFDDVEGMPIKEAMKLRDRYSKNVGTILVAFNDEQLMAAMADDRVDFIIPFHRSQWKKSQYAAMGLPAKTKDYTYMQNEKFINPQYHEYRGRMVKDKATNYMPNEYWDFSKSGKENAQAYLEMCARNNKRPKFYKLLQNNGDGSYSLKADGSTDGYWKLLIDFKMYDNAGNSSPQVPVRPEFNMDEATRMLNDYKGGHSNFPVAQGIVDDFVKSYKASHKGTLYSSQETDIDRAFVEYGDVATEKAAINKTVARLVSEGKYVRVAAEDVEKHRTSGEWDSRKGARQYLKKILKGFLGKSVRFNHNIVRAEAYLTKEGFNHSAVGLNTPEKAAAFSKYYSLIANSEYSYSSKNDTHSHANARIGGKIDWDNFVAVAMIEDEPYPVIFKVRTIDQDIRSQIYRMATKNEIGSTHDYGKQNDLPDALPNYGGTPISGNKVTQNNPEVNKKPLHSTQQTDNLTDRDMLANAFETISRSSAEYEMIQDYKNKVDLLNKLERELDGVNREIRDIRFSTGKRDSQQLELLESKAKRLAKDITKYDKRLLNMEASEPLRKVIARERKKEAQKTKDHVKEIQQNKKLRAEQTELRHKIRKAVRDLDKILNRGNKNQNVKEDMKDFVSKAMELADYLFTDHISNDELIRRGITVRMTPKEAALVKETEDILSKLYDNADNLTDEEFTKLDAKRKANEDKLRDLLTAQRNERLNTPVAKLFDDLVKAYASLRNSNQDAVKAAYSEELENSLRAFTSDDAKLKILQNMRVADMTTEELNWLYRAYTMVLNNVRNANKFHVKGMTETIDQKVDRIASDFRGRKIPGKKLAIVIRNLTNKIGWDYEKLAYALDRIGSEAFTELVMNIANSENVVMQDVIEAAAFRDKMVEKYGFNNWAVNKEIDREFLDNTGKKFKLTLGQMMALYAYSRREGAWEHIEYGGFVFGEAALTNPRPADSYKLSKDQCEAITNTLTKAQKAYVEDMQKFLSETMGEKGNEVSMMLYGIKMFGEKNYFPIHVAGQFKAQAQESQAKSAAGFGSMSNAGFTHSQNPNAKAPFVLEGFNEVWSDHVNEMSRYHGTVPALEDMRRVMNRSSYSDSGLESTAIKQLMENSYGKEAVEYFDNLYREANSGAITDKLQHTSKKLLSLFRKNSVAYSLSVLIQQPASLVRAYAMIDKKYFGFKGFGAITSGVTKAVISKWNPAYVNAYSEMLKYAPGVTMAKEIGGFDTATGGSIRTYLLDTNKSTKQKWKTEDALGKGKAVLDLVDNNTIANLPNVADKIAWIEIWNACKRETVKTHKDLVPNSEEFMQAVGERFTEVIRATQVYDSIFAKSPMLKSKNLAVQYLVSFMNEPNTIANMVEKAVRDVTRGDWKQGARTAAVVIHSIIFTNLLKSLIYALRDDDEDETYTEKYIEAVVSNMMNDINPLNYIPVARDVWSIAQGYDVERADMAIVADALDALDRVLKIAFTDTGDMTEEELIEFDKKVTEANWKLVESVAAFFGIPIKNIRREINALIDHARIASANAGLTTDLSAHDTIYEAVVDSIPFMSSKKSKGDKLYDAIVSGDKKYLGRLKATYKTEEAYHTAVRKALTEKDPRIRDAAQAHINGNPSERVRIAKQIIADGFDLNDVILAINSEISKLTPDEDSSSTAKVKGYYNAEDFVREFVNGDTTALGAIREDILKTARANGKTEAEAQKNFASDIKSEAKEAYLYGSLSEAAAEKLLTEHAGMDEEEAAETISYWAFQNAHPEHKGLSQSNVENYLEFAEPAGIDVRTYASFTEKISGLSSDKDANGKITKSKKDKVLEVIDSMRLTKSQKDALYYAAGYAESELYKAPWH